MSTKDLIRHSLMCLGFHLGSDSKESDLIKVDIWKPTSCKTLCHPVHIISIYFYVWWPREIHIYTNGPELRFKTVERCVYNCKVEEHRRKRDGWGEVAPHYGVCS